MATATKKSSKSAPFGYKADGTPRKRPVPTAAIAAKRAASKAVTDKPVVKSAPSADQRSVTGTFKLASMPKGKGGVRFNDATNRGFSPVYVSQADFATMGSPDKIRVTITAL